MYIYKFMNNLYIMETEKYYGLNETTTIDSSNIDCKYSDQTEPVNPLLNTTTTIISPIKNYKKLVDCASAPAFTLTEHNDAITDSSLQVREIKLSLNENDKVTYSYSISIGTDIMLGTPKDVYLGYEDTNKIFTNKLSSIITTQVTTLDSDTDGCSAKVYLIPNDNTGAPIKFSLNKCTANRIITFSYQNTPIFKIDQTYDKSGKITIYVCKLDAVLTSNDRFALFDTNSSKEIPVNPYERYIKYQEGYYAFVSEYVLMYTEDKKVREDTNIGTLLSTGKLTYLSGHDYLVKDKKYKDLKLANINTMQVHHFDGTGPLTSMPATIDMNLYVYAKINSDYYQYMPGNIVNFNNTESPNHLGVYKLQIAT